MKTVIIGSGIGGLSAGIRLAATGHEVHIYEKNAFPGGKINNYYKDGYRFDLGPTLLTLPEHLYDLFHFAGEDINDYLTPLQPDVSCRYFFHDHTVISAYTNTNDFSNELKRIGENPQNLERYLKQQKKIYDATHHLFLESAIHKPSNFIKRETLLALKKMPRLNLFKTVHQVNKNSFDTPHLVQLFDRYATYNGSNPYKAPGIFTMIAHLEHTLGAYYLREGMYSLTQALELLAQKTGVKIHYQHPVDQILYEKNHIHGISVNNEIIEADSVISNVDINTTYHKLLPHLNPPGHVINQPLSNSAIIFIWGMNQTFPQLTMHNILFSKDYKKEFREIFHEKTLPENPTIYNYISSKAISSDAPEGKENWHVMINVPANNGQDWDQLIKQARKTVINKIYQVLNITVNEHMVFEKVFDPRTIEHNTGSWRGALYGASSNNPMSAFLRHANFSRKIKGLYFCGGSVHPGGGIPLCLLSGKIVSQLVHES